MILLSVGTQLPFDRLVSAIDDLALRIDAKIVGQIGKTNYIPKNFPYYENIAPMEFEELICKCDVIISHAGIGTILNGRKYNKPVLVVPRRLCFKEHRNDHQLATVASLRDVSGIYVAENPKDITPEFLDLTLNVDVDNVSDNKLNELSLYFDDYIRRFI